MAVRLLALVALAPLVVVAASGLAAADAPLPIPLPELPDLSKAPVNPAHVPVPASGQPAPSNGAPMPGAPGFASGPGNPWSFAIVGGIALTGGLAMFAALGTRFRDGEELLQHDVRSGIYAYVQEHVGASLKDITESQGLSTTNAVWHLRKLEEGGLVRGKKCNGAKVYYPTSGGAMARDLSLAGAALTSGNAKRILAFVAEHPGVHQREVARLLGVNHGTVRWHLKKLRMAELLEERRIGASATYHLSPLGEVALRHVQQRAVGQDAPTTITRDTTASSIQV
ncbi:MAG: winged helix-turn-helix transcriptional regulator [Halobacteriales archaeon]|nr:winged helix-turn-helix transcriptional regulator [Halobacteriales archaeon]